jgi:hypothetical protein
MISLTRMLFPHSATDIGSSDGANARRLAEQELLRVRSETPYYEGLGRELRALRERNHFADGIRATLRGA